MITKLALLTGLILTNTAFATETAAINNHLTIAAIDQQKGLFNVRELHDMGHVFGYHPYQPSSSDILRPHAQS